MRTDDLGWLGGLAEKAPGGLPPGRRERGEIPTDCLFSPLRTSASQRETIASGENFVARPYVLCHPFSVGKRTLESPFTKVAGPYSPGGPVEPLQCPVCPRPMRVIALIGSPEVVEKILRPLNLWSGPAAFVPARPPPGAEPDPIEPDSQIDYDPMPDYENVITD